MSSSSNPLFTFLTQALLEHLPLPSSPLAATSTSRKMAQPYFAYGSNLHVAQMAQRCPDSVFLGKATLPGYRWQINQRGVANVVKSPRHDVEGLVFLVTPTDEAVLDRSEGVSKSLYLKKQLSINFEPHPSYANVKSSELAERLAQSHVPGRSSTRPRSRAPDNSELMEALVYVSDKFNTDGCIRAEYIQRMRNATADAVALGVSHTFIDDVIRPHLLPVPAPAAERTPSVPASKPTPSQILLPIYPFLTYALQHSHTNPQTTPSSPSTSQTSAKATAAPKTPQTYASQPGCSTHSRRMSPAPQAPKTSECTSSVRRNNPRRQAPLIPPSPTLGLRSRPLRQIWTSRMSWLLPSFGVFGPCNLSRAALIVRCWTGGWRGRTGGCGSAPRCLVGRRGSRCGWRGFGLL